MAKRSKKLAALTPRPALFRGWRGMLDAEVDNRKASAALTATRRRVTFGAHVDRDNRTGAVTYGARLRITL